MIILDNASFHKRLDVLEKIERLIPNIHLGFLPTYSPDFNLIEWLNRCFRELSKKGLHQSTQQGFPSLFGIVDELEKAQVQG